MPPDREDPEARRRRAERSPRGRASMSRSLMIAKRKRATQRSGQAIRRLDRVVYRVIASRRRSGEDRGDLLSMLLRAQDADDGTGMTDRQVRDEVMTLFMAGHETTAVALSWAWYLLAQHPEVDARLAEECGRCWAVALPPRAICRASLTPSAW